MGEILKIPEAAKILGVSPQFLRQQIRTGNWKFGERIKNTERDTYIVYRSKLERWKNAQD